MADNILLLGCQGSMGRRYSAILEYMGVDHVGVDVGEEFDDWDSVDGVIIATPTETHIDLLHRIPNEIPILCEKPISRNFHEVVDICKKGLLVQMVNQYKYLTSSRSNEVTYYDYYNHGKDILPWDGINILGLARGAVVLNDKSPIWRCQINGDILKLSDMDQAYIDMVGSWLENYDTNLEYILQAHEAVLRYMGDRQCGF